MKVPTQLNTSGEEEQTNYEGRFEVLPCSLSPLTNLWPGYGMRKPETHTLYILSTSKAVQTST